MSEELTVTAESPIVDVTSKEVGGNISDRELTDLPSVNRNYIGFIGLLPGVVPNISTESFGSDSVSVNGQDARNNNYLLDGGNNNDDVIGQRAGTQARTPLEAIQEFQVLTNQYDAEFGRTTGAVVNAITKQGDQQLPRQRLRVHPGRLAHREGLLRREEQPGEAGHHVPAVRLHARRPGDQGQGPLLREPRARDRRPRRHINDPVPARAERRAGARDAGLEHARALRPPDQRGPHLERALAARDLAAVQPDHPVGRPGVARDTGGLARGGRPRPDARRLAQLRARQHARQHAALRLHAGGRVVRDAGLQRQRPAPGPAAADAALPHLRRPAETRWRRPASTTASSSRTPSPGSSRAPRATTTCASASSTSTRRNKATAQDLWNGTFYHSSDTAVQRRAISRPTRSGCRSACPARRLTDMKRALLRGLHPGQVAAQPAAHAEPRAALRPREDPDPGARQPRVLRSRTTTRSTGTTSRRGSASPGT